MATKHVNRLTLPFIPLLFIAYSCKTGLSYEKVDDRASCECKENAYWYKNRCWKDYEKRGYTEAEIDSVVAAHMMSIENARIRFGDVHYTLTGFFPFPEDKEVLLISTFETTNGEQTLVSREKKSVLDQGTFDADVFLFNGNALTGDMDSIPLKQGIATYQNLPEDNETYRVSGTLGDEGSDTTFSFEANNHISGAGTSKLEIRGNEAFLSGDLGTRTYYQIQQMIKEHPEVNTLVLTHISGSINDEVNVHTGRIVREARLTTKVLSDGEIASGGVDLFCAGKERIVHQGAKIGIHSWCCFNDFTALELPKDHPAHQDQLKFFTMVMGPVDGPNFYFYTLEAAPFNDVHWMTDEEIQHWKVSTRFICN